jgi:excisionase family DNA binding protein
MAEYLSVKEAADMLRLSVPTIYKFCTERRIPFAKVGTRTVFDRDDLIAWVNNRKVEPIGVKS